MTEPDFLCTTRTSYDAVAADYAERFRDELTAKPLDRAMLAGFAELVHRRQPDRVAELLSQAGLVVRARLLREPDDDGDFTERTQQAFLLARKPVGADRP
jgi:hypothetical protein